MAGYRLYYLDRQSHIVGRDEFFAEDDRAALAVAGSLHEASRRPHEGLMLWQGARQVFSSEDNDCLLVSSFPAGACA